MTQPYPLYDNIILTPINGVILELHPFIEPLLYKVAESNPHWTLEQDHYNWLNGKMVAADFKVINTATKEVLGDLGVDVRRSPSGRESVFSIHNERIQSKRDRGHSYKTAKLKDALKTIRKEFYPRTVKERVHTGLEQAQWYIAHALRSSQQELEDVKNSLGKVALSVVRRAHWDVFMQVLTEVAPELAKKATDLDELIEQHNQMEAIHNNYSSKKLLTVIIDGDKYTVVDNADVRTYTSDDLPEQVKQQVGLLKLVEEKEVVAGVGLRVGELYFINAAN